MPYCTIKTMSQTRGKAMQNRFRCKEKGASEEAPAQRAENICLIVALRKVRKNNGGSTYGRVSQLVLIEEQASSIGQVPHR